MSKKNKLRKDEELIMSGDANHSKKDNSPYVHQRDKIKFKLDIRQNHNLTEKQNKIIETMIHKDTRCVFIDGLYGCSKTYLAVYASLQLLNSGKVDEIIYIRNPVESTTTGKLGFVPGTADEKLEPYVAPLIEKLDEFLDTKDVDRLKKEKRISGFPLGFVRGHSWNCKAIIVDEAASLTRDDIILLMTRCGPFTRIFFIGDSANQNDIGNKTGFRNMLERFWDQDSRDNGVHVFEMREKSDVVRSGFARFVMEKIGLLKYESS